MVVEVVEMMVKRSKSSEKATKKRRKSDEKVAEKQQKTALFTAKMINEVEYNDFQTVKYCSVGAGTSFQGRWNVFIGINRCCVGSCKSGGSGGFF